jgi:hypothetical protein
MASIEVSSVLHGPVARAAQLSHVEDIAALRQFRVPSVSHYVRLFQILKSAYKLSFLPYPQCSMPEFGKMSGIRAVQGSMQFARRGENGAIYCCGKRRATELMSEITRLVR